MHEKSCKSYEKKRPGLKAGDWYVLWNKSSSSPVSHNTPLQPRCVKNILYRIAHTHMHRQNSAPYGSRLENICRGFKQIYPFSWLIRTVVFMSVMKKAFFCWFVLLINNLHYGFGSEKGHAATGILSLEHWRLLSLWLIKKWSCCCGPDSTETSTG